MRPLALALLPQRLVICRLTAGSPCPDWALSSTFCAVTRTPEELSIVCEEESVPGDLRCDKGWRALKIEGPLDLSDVGIVLSLAEPLAAAGVAIFVISTYETDYTLVRESQLEEAVAALMERGHTLRR
jgi:hypothetical protein